MITIKTENNLMLCSFEAIQIQENDNPDSFIKKYTLVGYLPSRAKLLLASFDTLDEAVATLNAIYANIPGAVSLSLADRQPEKAPEPEQTPDILELFEVRSLEGSEKRGGINPIPAPPRPSTPPPSQPKK